MMLQQLHEAKHGKGRNKATIMNRYSNNYYSKFNFDIISLGKLPRGG